MALDLFGTNIGNALIPGSLSPVSGGYDILAGGSGIGSSSDQLFFNYQLRNGNFDQRVRVESLSLADAWSRAGLMARETLASNSVFAAAFATPASAAAFFRLAPPRERIPSVRGISRRIIQTPGSGCSAWEIFSRDMPATTV